jgi:hypothetical protein
MVKKSPVGKCNRPVEADKIRLAKLRFCNEIVWSFSIVC